MIRPLVLNIKIIVPKLLFKKASRKADNSSKLIRIAQLQSISNKSLDLKITTQLKENNTRLPNNLKTGIENLSEISLDEVKVHWNLDKPAKLNGCKSFK